MVRSRIKDGRQEKLCTGKACRTINPEGLWKPLTEFYKNKTTEDGLQTQCKECVKQYTKDHAEEKKQYWKQYRKDHVEEMKHYWKQYTKDHAEERSQRQTQRNRKHRQVWLTWFHEQGLDFCEHCGYNRCFAAIDFHHINPKEKENNIAKMIRKVCDAKNQNAVLKEAAKCKVLCKNCHMEVHAGLIFLD